MDAVDDLQLDYHFSPQEIRVLAHFFREQQANIPDGLEEFAMAVEKAIYNSMSIDEAQAFYS